MILLDFKKRIFGENSPKIQIGEGIGNNCLLKKIDLQFSQTHIKAHNERTLLGIYDVDEDTLTFITAAPGKNSRPLSFDEPQEAVVFSFVRS